MQSAELAYLAAKIIIISQHFKTLLVQYLSMQLVVCVSWPQTCNGLSADADLCLPAHGR